MDKRKQGELRAQINITKAIKDRKDRMNHGHTMNNQNIKDEIMKKQFRST